MSSLHHERFAVGSAVNQTARQVGGALGVAVLVVILGTPSSQAEALGAFHHLWWFAVAMALSSGVVCLFLDTKRRADARAAAGRSTPEVLRAPVAVGKAAGPVSEESA